MTTPSIVPTGYAGTTADYLNAKVDRSGSVRVITGSVSVPSSTASATVIGLAPFKKGAKFCYGSRVYTADLDTATSVTLDVGYVYDSGSGDTPNAFVAAATTAQTGGIMEMTAVAGMTWTATEDGWFVVKTGGGSTTTTGSLTFNLQVAYDASGVTNA